MVTHTLFWRTITATAFWLASLQFAQAFYSPATGRWLSRDPIGEKGGINLYGFVRNAPLSAIDLLGLDYHETVAFDGLLNILRTYDGADAFTGDPNTKGLVQPHPLYMFDHKVTESPGGCCAQVERAQRVDVDVLTVLANDAIGGFYTKLGYHALMGHEGRRREIYRKGYDAYIAPIQGTGARVTQCGILCSYNAKGLLLNYLGRLQDAGIAAFNAWVGIQQANVGEESSHIKMTGDLMDGYDWTYMVPEAPPLQEVPCVVR